MTKLAVSIKLDTKGLNTLTGRARTMPDVILRDSAKQIEHNWKQNIEDAHAVDTGAYKNGIEQKPSEKKLQRIIGDSVEYGVYVEFGTSKMPARPCATPAVEAERPYLLKAWEAMFKL